jgi:hypothetical protein
MVFGLLEKRKRKSGERERDREKNNVRCFKKCSWFFTLLHGAHSFLSLKIDKFTGLRLNPPCVGKKDVID